MAYRVKVVIPADYETVNEAYRDLGCALDGDIYPQGCEEMDVTQTSDSVIIEATWKNRILYGVFVARAMIAFGKKGIGQPKVEVLS